MYNWLLMLNYWHWLILGLSLLLLELLGAGGFLFWIGIAALVTGLVNGLLPSISGYGAALFFAAFAIINSIFCWQYLKRNPPRTEQPRLNRRSEQYIGRVFTLVEPIQNGRGKIRIGDTLWRVAGTQDLPEGTRVTVVAVDGVILRVEPYEPTESKY